MPDIADFLEPRYPYLRIRKGGTRHIIRWLKVSGDTIAVEPLKGFLEAERVEGTSQAARGMGLLNFTAVVRKSDLRSRHDYDELVVEAFDRVQQREFNRASLREPVLVMCTLFDEGIELGGEIVNISAGGTGFLITREIAPETLCGLNYTLVLEDEEDAMEMTAKVVRQVPMKNAEGLWYTAARFVLRDVRDPAERRQFNINQRILTKFVDQYNIRLARREAREKG